MIQLILKILSLGISIFNYFNKKKQDRERYLKEIKEHLKKMDIEGESLLEAIKKEQDKTPQKTWEEI